MKKAELERLFREYYPEMYQRALTILYDRQESDDVVCGIFEVLLRQDMEPLFSYFAPPKTDFMVS